MFGEELLIVGAIAGVVAARERMKDRRLERIQAAARQARLDEQRRYNRAKRDLNAEAHKAYRAMAEELYGR